MASPTYTLKIVTPNEVFFEGPVEHTSVPGALGYMGILANHAPLVTPIEKGNVTYRDAGGRVASVAVEGGFLEILKNRVLVLTDRAESL